nr:membrane-like protein [Desulforamulus aquiferis]
MAFYGLRDLEMGLATPLVIWLVLRLGLGEVVMALVPMVIILSSPREAFLTEAFNRSIGIFIGLVSGVLVNGLIAPPHYREKLIEVSKRLNEVMAEFFCSLATRFNNISPMPDEEYLSKRNEIKSLLTECRVYLELWKEQSGKETKQLPWQDQLLERYIDFNSNLYHKSKDIYEATEERIQWRKQHGNPSISPEFEAILAMLAHGNKDFVRLNKRLQGSLFEGESAEHYPVDEEFWQEMSTFVDQWHERLTGSHYLHAFMFLAVVANNLKFANRTAKEFLNIIHENQDFGCVAIQEKLKEN